MENQKKIDKINKLLNDEKYTGDKELLEFVLHRLQPKKIISNDTYRTKECYIGRGNVREQKKRYKEKYVNYELSWGGIYSNYECLLRIDPFLFD